MNIDATELLKVLQKEQQEKPVKEPVKPGKVG